MTTGGHELAILIRKLLRDVWLALTVVCLLLAAFQCLWVKVTQRICGDLVPLISGLAVAAASMRQRCRTCLPGTGQDPPHPDGRRTHSAR